MLRETTTSSATGNELNVIVGTREQLLYLLAEASEIEHTLMCSYLFAAFSLRRAGEDGLSPEEVEVTERWHKSIMEVAIEEMGHLLIVANLTVAIGGRPHFARPNFPVSPGYFPSSVVVRLTPFSKETMEHFIFLERPKGIDGEDHVSFDSTHYGREQANQILMPGGQNYQTIGHLYEAIRVNLEALDARYGGPKLFLGGDAGQIGPGVIDMEGVRPITDLVSALRSIDVIVEQGEGAPADHELSHYRKFLSIHAELETLQAANPGFTPAWPVVENPVLRRPPEQKGMTWIEHPRAAALLDFACATYGLLLRFLIQCFVRTGVNRLAEQELLVTTAFALMHCLAEVSAALPKLPAAADANSATAGMSFTMLRGVEPLVSGPPEELLLREQLLDLADVAHRLNLPLAGKLTAISYEFRLGKADDLARPTETT